MSKLKGFSLGKWQDYRMMSESPENLSEWSQMESSITDLAGMITDQDQMFKLRQSPTDMEDQNKRRLIMQSITFLVKELKSLI